MAVPDPDVPDVLTAQVCPCGRSFERRPGPGRPRRHCYVCRPARLTVAAPAAPLAVIDPEPWDDDDDDVDDPEIAALLADAARLDADADRLAVAAQAQRVDAARLRAKADRLRESTGVVVKRARTALDAARHDGLLAAAALAVEDLAPGFVAADLAGLLDIRDQARATRLILALEELGKVARYGAGWMDCDPDEIAVRDHVIDTRDGSLGGAVLALGLHEIAVGEYLAALRDRGLIELAGGHFRYVEPTGSSAARPRRRPPENDPPAYSDVPKRGEPVRLVDHGQAAKAGTRHAFKLRQQRYAAMQTAKEARAAEQRAKQEARR